LATIFWKQRFGEANKACVHVVGRYGSRYAVDVSARHEVPDATFPFNTSGAAVIRPIMSPGRSAIMALIEKRRG
jgi:hypothetical protein